MKQKVVTHKQFKEFCAEFTRWQMKMGLNGGLLLTYRP